MATIDWILLVLPIVLVLCIALYTNRYVKSVADFLAGGRLAGRYLLANARGESDSGLSNTLSKFEIIMVSGFVLTFWEKVSVPVMLLIGISGFVIYRFRETRALTLAQFFEMRYSRRFRLFMGGLAFVSGILNYGIFPAVSARFFIFFLELPAYFAVGPFQVSTFAAIMFTYLTCTVLLVNFGGQATAMVTDCIEGILSHAIYLVIIVAVALTVHWSQAYDVLANHEPGRSQLNPFDAEKVQDFNIWFVIMNLIMFAYTRMALQNRQGFNAAARTPHEARMADVLGNWRSYARNLMLLVLVIAAMTFMTHADFKGASQPAHDTIQTISDPYIQKQMTVPVALSHMLPVGVKGLFCAIMLMGLLAGDAGHMHSWGGIFVQDVIAPLKKTPMSPRAHILALRAAVTFVALFAFVFSMVFTQTQYIALWWAVTAGVFVGGAGATIIGGLYWRRGTAPAAWSAAIVGGAVSLAGIICSNGKVWQWVIGHIGEPMGIALPPKFWLNGLQTSFLAACLSVVTYVTVSLLTSRQKFNLDRMLHRDEAAVRHVPTLRERFRLKSILRFDHNFTFWDKLVSGGIFWWAILLLGVNLVVSIINLRAWYWPGAPGHAWLDTHWIEPWSLVAWALYWQITGIGLPLVISVITLVWFGIGGIMDIRSFFRALSTARVDSHDDGRVMVQTAPETKGLESVQVIAGPERLDVLGKST
ncbi:MAG: sodium:proline symporter [Burkholderiales bacterium]|nr:sodium:proline symporter [Phycisphaerae bacterium]